jgi:L-2-hydroxyglutarate oxidase LhgO
LDTPNCIFDWQESRLEASKTVLCQGSYFLLEGKPPFCHLIYAVPAEPGGLGVHVTVDWSGHAVKFGPDVEWLDPDVDLNNIRLVPDLRQGEKFYDQVRKYWPLLPNNKLVPDYVGVRSEPSVCSNIGFKLSGFSNGQARSTSWHPRLDSSVWH